MERRLTLLLLLVFVVLVIAGLLPLAAMFGKSIVVDDKLTLAVYWRAVDALTLMLFTLPGVVAGWLIGFIFCLRDLGASMLVYPAGQGTLPVRIYTLMLMANGAPSLISALCLIVVAVTLASLAILGSLLRATGRHR